MVFDRVFQRQKDFKQWGAINESCSAFFDTNFELLRLVVRCSEVDYLGDFWSSSNIGVFFGFQPVTF